ncbi:MAG: biotin--[acetyl-CoA-carboxylase] ligase [Bacteroidetes bacterium]|nr:biotin--[acetyl-CoA-carboxylase] ligase [Bacteroidota bacterium]
MADNMLRLGPTTSTHKLLSEMLQAGEPVCGKVITADFQTGGRGQGNNTWHSAPGQNLLMSFCWCPRHLAASRQFEITMAVSLAIAGLMDAFAIPSVSIKWPNDIWSGNSKLAGVLISNTVSGALITHSIISIGLNVNQLDFPEELPNPVSMRMLSGRIYDRHGLLAELMDYMKKEIGRIEQGDAKLLRINYLNRLRGLGEIRQFRIGGNLVDCKIAGVDEFGRIQLATAPGQLQAYDLSEARMVQ